MEFTIHCDKPKQKNMHMLCWKSKSTDLNPKKNLCPCLKCDFNRHSPSNVTCPQLFCEEVLEAFLLFGCAKLVKTLLYHEKCNNKKKIECKHHYRKQKPIRFCMLTYANSAEQPACRKASPCWAGLPNNFLAITKKKMANMRSLASGNGFSGIL